MNIQAKRVDEIATEQGRTIRELAEFAGCSKSAMQRYITGERSMPLDAIEGIAKHTGVHPAYLMGWVDDRFYEDKKEQPAGDGELSPKRKAFIDKVMRMSDEELDRLEQILSLVEGTK